MIFKTINSSVDETRKTLALFNKDWNTYKRNWQNANGVFGKIGSVFTPANAITKSDIEAIKAYNSQIDSCVTSQTAFNRTMLNASPATQDLVASYNGGKVSAQGMATAQNAAKASTIGLTIAQTALNAAIGMGIGLLISLVVKGIDKLVHANEKAIEKAEELRRKYEEFKSTNESNVTTLNGLKKEFEELSKGVSQYGDNISLTTEQYERYKEIIQQIVGMSPSLAEGYSTENGYIADKNGLLERAIELQEQEYRNELRKITNLDNLKTSMSGYIAEYKEAFNGGLVTDDMSAISTTTATDLSNALYQAFNLNGSGKHTYDNTEKIARKIIESLGIEDVNSEIQKYINKNGIFESSWFFKAYADTIAENIEVITDSLSADIVGLDDTVFNQNIEKVDSAAQSYIDMKDAISMANESIQRDLGYIAEYADGYSNLSTEQQKFVNEFLKGYDISDIMSESNNPFDQGWKFDEDKMASVKSQITKFVEALSQDETTKSALADLYAIPTDEQSISEFIEQFRNALEIIKAYCQENGIEIPIAITDSEQTINDLEAQYQRAVDFAKKEFDGYDPTAFFKEHSINTQEEIDKWQKIAQGAMDAAEAEKKYLNQGLETEIFSSFSDTDLGERIQHITNLFNEGSISHKEYFDALQSEINNFDVSNFTSSIEEANAASQQFFTDSVQQTANGLSNLINKFDSGSIGISEYLEGYLSIAETMSTLTDELQKNSEAWDENGNALSDTSNSALDSTQENMANAISVIQSYQDSIYSLEQIMTGTIEAGSNEFAAHAEVIAEDLARIVATGGEMADEISSVLGTTTAEIAQSLTESVSNQSLASQAIAANTNTAIGDMANSIGELFDTLGNAISNFKVDVSFGIKKISTQDVDMGILGTHKLPKIDFALEANGQSLDAIGSAISSFGKTISSNLKPQMIELPDFTFGNTEAGKNSTYKPSPGITKNYEDAFDKIKESAKDASKSAKDSADDIKNVFKETFDFFDQRVNVLDDALSLLKTNLDNVTGSFAKNKLVDAELGITEEKFKNYTDALSMYTQKANEALSKLPSDIAAKIKDGAVDLTTFIGDGNEEVVEAIKDYQNWADKIADCKQELAELKTAIRQLELEKFNNIMEDFTNQFDLHEDGKDLISKQIDLLKEAGQLIGESFFTTQIDQSKKQLAILEEEKVKLVEQLNSALSSGRIQKGTDEWLEMVNALSDVEGSILDAKTAIEEFDNELLQLHWDIFDRIQDQFSNLDSELSNLGGLFDDLKISDGNGNWTNEGIARLGLLTQQYELAQYQVKQYNEAIDKLNADYLAGKYSATEYADKLAELTSAQWDAVNSSESIKDAIIELNETRINEEIEGIEKEISAYRDLIDAQIKALKASRDLHDYEESIAEKTKSVTDLERQIAAMQNDNTAATIAKKKLLEEQLAEARKNLENAEYDHSIQTQEDALNKQYEDYEAERNAEIEALKTSLEERETLIAQSFESVKANADIVGQEIALIATQHGITVSNALISSWQNGETSIASYGAVLSENSSAFIANLMGVESEVYGLQEQANTTADSLSYMFATRADNLVNELTSSYYSEENLNTMTQALRDSLVNTLEGGYNVSGITSALNSIAEGANNVASAANSAAQALAAMGAAQQAVTTTTAKTTYSIHQTGAVDPTYTVKDSKGNIVSSGNTLKQAQDYIKSKNAYASGTRNAKGGLRVVGEEGNELELMKLPSGHYEIGNAGDQILTKAQTDNIFDWSKLNPADLVPYDIMGSLNLKLPDIEPRNVNNNPVQIGNLITVQGNVDSSNIKQMESIANKAVDKLVNKMYDGFKYRRI